MRLDYFLIGMVMLSLFITLGTLMIGDANKSYGLDMMTDNSSAFGEVYKNVDNMYNLSGQMYNQTIGGSELDEDEKWQSMATGSYGAIRLTRNSWDATKNILHAVAKSVGVDPIYITGVLTIILLSIIFGIIYMVMRFKP